MSYRIGSFNCRHLGKASAGKKDLTLIARMINGEGFDVVALQELHGEEALELLLSTLNHESLNGAKWEGEADAEVSDYGFVWNAKKLRKVETVVEGAKRVYQPTIYKQYRLDRSIGQKKFVRNPYYARFEPCHPNAAFVELRLINTHIRFSKGKDGEIDNSPSAVVMRQNEFAVLSRALFPSIEDKIYGNNKPSYTILLGDYNLNLLRGHTHHPYLWMEEVYVQDGKSEKRIITVQDKLTTLKSPVDDKKEDVKSQEEKKKAPPMESLTGEQHFSNNFDHCTYNRLRMQDGVQISTSRVDVLKYLPQDGGEDSAYSSYLKDVSDHVPIIIELDL